jgi:hypothetical protein
VKSSTIYELKLILIVYVLLWKKQNCVRSIFAAVKNNFFLDEREIAFFFFHLSIAAYVFVKESKIHHKMQREKLYNLYTTTYFLVALSGFQK